MNTEKFSQYFFLIAAVLAILDGAFTLQNEMQSAKFIVLILSGIAVGVLRQHKKEAFLISGTAVVITGLLFTQLLGANLAIFTGVLQMILNFVLFLSAALLVTGLHFVSNIMTGEKEPEEELSESEKKIIHEKYIFPHHQKFEKVWGYVMLGAVALTFIILLSETFFDVQQFILIISVVDLAITALFITDLFVLYQHSSGPMDFFKRHIFDIVAAIPTVGILRVLKLIRVVRFIKVLKGGSKLTKLSKVHKTTKFLSEESSFNKVKSSDKKKSSVHHKKK